MQDQPLGLPVGALASDDPFHSPFEQPNLGNQTPPDTITENRLQFVGSGSEYFRIWIVNLLLSLLTLGIYSAWAKVRREQYFHRNTLLDGSGFDYHGKPIPILKGRIIAVGLLAILVLIEKFVPAYYFLALLLLLPLFPWLLIRSFIFRARNTSFRGLHFDFRGTYKGFCKAFLGYLLIFVALGWVVSYSAEQLAFDNRIAIEQSIDDENDDDDTDEEEAGDEVDTDLDEVTEETKNYKLSDALLGFAFEVTEGRLSGTLLGLAFVGIFLLIPAIIGTLKRFQLNHLAFGASGFRIRCRLSSFYSAYLRAMLPLLACVVVFVLIFAAAGAAAKTAFVIALVPFMILFFVFYMVALITTPAYLGALIANLVWNNTRLEKHAFVSDQTFQGIAGIVVSNWLLISLTLGLYWPWAKVRLTAYRASRTAVLVSGSLDHFVAGASREKSAIGEEIADIFDFDIAI
ncbi:MAG: DUF898 domain-containing protein [Burkholderiales bacterium]|jgi:uncharacterized membrane protein YjgN (DUF898 family)|nr:DUF898 domain-containing protein [Burkholderiales bacterium]